MVEWFKHWKVQRTWGTQVHTTTGQLGPLPSSWTLSYVEWINLKGNEREVLGYKEYLKGDGNLLSPLWKLWERRWLENQVEGWHRWRRMARVEPEIKNSDCIFNSKNPPASLSPYCSTWQIFTNSLFLNASTSIEPSCNCQLEAGNWFILFPKSFTA